MEQTQAPIKFSPYQILVIALIALTQFSVVLDFMVMSPLGDLLIKTMRLSTDQFGYVVSAYAFSAGISGILTAGFADRFDRKKLLLFFYIGFIAGTLSCALAGSYEALIIARIVTGIFGGVIGSISMAIVTDLFLPQQRGRVMGFVQMGFGASQVLGIPISLYFANRLGWEAPFFIIVAFSAVVWLVMLLRLRPVNAHLMAPSMDTRKPLEHLWHTFRNREYRIGFLATALMSLGGFMMMPFGTAYAINNLGLTKEQMPTLFMISGISALIIMPVMGRLSDKMNKAYIFSVASVWLIIFAIIYTNLPPSALWLVATINTLMMMGVMGRVVPAVALNSSLPAMPDRGAFMAINTSLQQMAGGVAAAIAGKIVTQATPKSPLMHFDTVGYILSVVCIINIVMFFRVYRMVQSRAVR
ncbi:MFS transporter [Rurimicrobium arvi]|uniref:MFS transporter n=1 Tax=Rurimicrobium arvi TaxID=2049916 RepID=A0ABP8MQY8_9BACT